MASAGFLIYSGIMPLIKTFIAIFFGYFLTKKGMFPAAASRGASQVTMNISLPALIFANIVPAFTPQNVSAIGPLFLIAFVYQIIGFTFGIIIREVFYVPRNFWQGIIILSGMSNWGNLPNAVVTSVTQQAPFDPTTDPQLGVSFVAIFIVSYHLVFWVCGAAHSLSWDYLPGVPQGEDAERRLRWNQKPVGRFIANHILRQNIPPPFTPTCEVTSDDEKGKEHVTTENVEVTNQFKESKMDLEKDPDIQLTRRTSHLSALSYRSPIPQSSTSAAPALPPLPPSPAPPEEQPQDSSSRLSFFLPPVLQKVLKHVSVLFGPVTTTLLISLPIALIQPLKALFVDVSSMGGPNWKGPDGRPPLAFVIDTAEFVGDIAIPLALILLGSSFARLKVPRPISRLPILAMIAVALAKMLILPVIGVLMIQGMVSGGLIDKDAKVEKFVAMFLSGTPAAVNQMIVSSLYSPDGDVDTLSAFLLVQYVFMFFSSSYVPHIVS
ncbi:auxin efflux carrier [Abortiporus biennis]|nr:auxin efflux carrier [Abortiporus biennis]